MIRHLATAAGVLASLLAAVALLIRFVPIRSEVVLALAAAAPYLTAAAVLGLVCFVVARRRPATVVAAILCVALIVLLLPRYLGPDPAPANSVPVRVLSLNLGMGQADPQSVRSAAESADVLVLQELTPQAAHGLAQAGIEEVFAHRVIEPRPGAAGIGVYSRYPIVDHTIVPGYSMPMLRARLEIDGVPLRATVLAVHIAAPLVSPLQYFTADIDRFPQTLRDVARDAGPGPVIVAGDFNATRDMLPFRRLLDTGYHDAAEQAGAGLVRTFPSGRRYPPLLGIDHVLVRNCVATSAATVPVAGSDHRGLLATVQVPVE
ncbi:endonuclease/Exonuclease/phosphatase family protein [Mycolicibacterium hassiacum DSM 44199]|mgnify:CR=1 FL=1|uniref:Endonuclease/Exonuclease/phosphatase family protein n=1 Tax=Mycolicibacterium hassiacum (strain DSM 44199 / CIP 105218 / JCM 12690 / 3849) TaxID=1122247 RepID=K5B9H4_MYCHD|nr:endonuclease/Exonuclease/phosphatase family protein [Mycolicibacterium hassiacum DSM 44199]MBX5488681.1 endonuclease/exonuclease/phosphatase family protein [Mycolicibacterium hassiacum]MDA4086163.1 endonuclease [Mycolicibacterium hassiacum DSM 44199]PZN18281.1 MAG: endonuclease [Mycolicibacterium hassiacum]VCT92980.1 hypothetical protein MHAS_04718 [Mycolicibacterium hassiacum DSM 44199]